MRRTIACSSRLSLRWWRGFWEGQQAAGGLRTLFDGAGKAPRKLLASDGLEQVQGQRPQRHPPEIVRFARSCQGKGALGRSWPEPCAIVTGVRLGKKVLPGARRRLADGLRASAGLLSVEELVTED